MVLAVAEGASASGIGELLRERVEVPPCLPAPVDAPEKAKADRMAGYIRQAYESRNPHFLNQEATSGPRRCTGLPCCFPSPR